MVHRLRAVQACVAAVSVLSPAVDAFPTLDNFAKLIPRYTPGLDDSSAHFAKIQEELFKLREKRLLFDPLTEPIDVTGEHAFVAPDLDAGDQRGPCPGLNALANHNYIPHDGVVGFVDLIDAMNTVYGMGIDLSTLLAIMGTVGVGNPLSPTPGFSIGGAPPDTNLLSSNILGNVLGLLGKPRGLQGSHNWIEGDSSNTRDDLYVTGDAWTMNMTLFKMAYDGAEGDVITMEDLGNRAAARFQESIEINPYFYYGPYTGLFARNAGYAFSGRLLSNHSKEFPGGQLTKDVFKSFFAVTDNQNGEMVYNAGHERIPENWFRTPVDYGLASLNLDLVSWAQQHPELASVGGNTGGVNTFAGVDLDDVTGGLLDATSLLEGNNLCCFALEVVKTFAPNALAPLFQALEVPLQMVSDAVVGPLLDLGCPAFQDLTMEGDDFFTGLSTKYPGAKRSAFML
ncbi:oxidase [Diaporthe helianthi]|uniref:Oxidase n=1 Tax=Diaporthe helianthi TaxID=158607 RepID=A0A2P5HNY4_DIAHE|nr:oxidase [Diaporthe helianthi]